MDNNTLRHLRRYDRRDIILESRVYFDGNGILSRVKNLSAGGVCVTLPFAASHYGLMQADGVEIQDLGYFSATKRWTSGFLIGLQFNNFQSASHAVLDFFEKIDTTPDAPNARWRKVL